MFTPTENEAMLRATGGVPVVVQEHPQTWGHLDVADDEVLARLGRGVTGVKYMLTLATGILPHLRQDAALSAGGDPYVVRQGGRVEDGGLCVYYLALPPRG